MDINRADAKLIRDGERQSALADFGLANAAPLATGTEAEVYELGQNTLLKLYADTSRLPHFQTLQKLYSSVDAAPSGFMLPHILARLTAVEKPTFFQFLLAHAILTSDLYATTPDPRTDDHFRWAAEIVAEEYYWENAL